MLEGFCWSYTASQCCFGTKFQCNTRFVGSLRPCTSAGENCPARYLENGSAKQLYPLNNIDSTARALYSQPRLFFEIFDSVFQKFTSKLLKLEKFYMGKTFRLNILRTGPQNDPDHKILSKALFWAHTKRQSCFGAEQKHEP